MNNSDSVRSSWDNVRMNMCMALAMRSTCWKKKTAAIIVHNNRIVSEGYNGTAAGEPHCTSVGPRDRIEHRSWSHANEVHAEINAILTASSHKGIPAGSTLYTILSPCIKCAQALVAVKISNVVYLDLYRSDGVEYLQKHGVAVLRHLLL